MTGTPHDALFKVVFQQTRHAADELRLVLPPELAALVDWSSLDLCSSETIDTELGQALSDLVYRARIGGRPGHLVLLLEHQSSQDSRIPLRLLEYMTGRWRQHWDEDPPNALPLPVVVPVVVAQTPSPWRAHRRFEDMFEATLELRGFVPHFGYAVDDLAATTDDELFGRALDPYPRTALWLLRNARTPDRVLKALPRWREPLTQVLHSPAGPDGFERLLRYVSVALEELRYEEFRDKLVELIPSSETHVMTIAQQLETRGEARGEARGRIGARREMLLVILEERGLAPTESQRQTIDQCEDPDLLEQWARAAVTADTVDAVIDDG